MSTTAIPVWTFGDRIRKIRRELHLTQHAFAEAIGRTEKAVAAWESGRTRPDDMVDVALTIEQVYGYPASWVAGLDGPNQGMSSDGTKRRYFSPMGVETGLLVA